MKKGNAYHQAGHAVVSLLLGLPFKYVSAEAKSDLVVENGCARSVGYIEGLVIGPQRKTAIREIRGKQGLLDLREALSAVAGPKAEEMARGAGFVRSPVPEPDYEDVACACRSALAGTEVTTGGGLESGMVAALKAQAETLLCKHWDGVEAVAAALERDVCVSRRSVERIVRGSGISAKVTEFFKGLRDCMRAQVPECGSAGAA